jgi:hypothetical protein
VPALAPVPVPALARFAQLGWGRHTNRAAHATVAATRTPVPNPILAPALRCRPRYRSVLA